MENHKRRHLDTCCARHPDTWSGQNKMLSPLMLLTHYSHWIITAHTMQKEKIFQLLFFWLLRGQRAPHCSSSPAHYFPKSTLLQSNLFFFFCCSTVPCSCRAECHPHNEATQLAIIFASASLSQLAETGPFPQRDVNQLSVNQDVTVDALQTWEQTSFSRALQRGVGNSCHSFLLLYCRRLTCGA